MKKSLFLIISILFPSLYASSQQTKVLTPERTNEYGLVYSLPVTALEIIVTAEKETFVAGPYAKYAKKYLAKDKIISENSEAWKIINVEVRPYGAVNPGIQYLMQLRPGTPTFLTVADNGMLRSINIKLPDPIGEPLFRPSPPPVHPTGKEYLQYVDEDFIASQSSSKQAEILASSIMEVRDARLSLTRGTADSMPTDGRQLELMLNSLSDQETAMTQAFTGFSYSETQRHVYTFVPEEDTTDILFRFSDFKGFCTPADYAGSPFKIRVNVTAQGTLPTDSNGKEKELPKDAVRYAIPGMAQITLSYDNQTYYNKELEFGQFGVVYGLNPAIFTDRKAPAYAIFNPATGGLSELGVTSESQ